VLQSVQTNRATSQRIAGEVNDATGRIGHGRDLAGGIVGILRRQGRCRIIGAVIGCDPSLRVVGIAVYYGDSPALSP
jgi:hypothetical protein